MLNDPSANPFVRQAFVTAIFAKSELHQAITFAPIDRKNMNPNAAIKISCNNLIWVLIRKDQYPKKLNIFDYSYLFYICTIIGDLSPAKMLNI